MKVISQADILAVTKVRGRDVSLQVVDHEGHNAKTSEGSNNTSHVRVVETKEGKDLLPINAGFDQAILTGDAAELIEKTPYIKI